MEFDNINIFSNLLWLVPALIVLVYLANKKRERILNLLTGKQIKLQLTKTLNPAARKRRTIFFSLAILLILMAAAEPWWGTKLTKTNQSSRDILVCIDTSRSMLAQDIKPTRLSHAKWWINELQQKFPADRFGLIAFAGEAIIECPLTMAHSSFSTYLENISTDSIALGGTNIGAALTTAYQAFEGAESENRAVILLTDGDELSGDSTELLADFKSKNIPVFTVGIGDPSQPGIIQLTDGKILYDAENNPVVSKLNEAGLARIAKETSGNYVRTTTVEPMLKPIIQAIGNINPSEVKSGSKQSHISKFHIPLLAGILLLFVYLFSSDRKRILSILLLGIGLSVNANNNRPLAFKPQQTLQPNPAQQMPAGSPQTQGPKAPKLDPKLAKEIEDIKLEITEQAKLKPIQQSELDRLNYNLGTLQFKGKLYDKALASYQNISLACDRSLKCKQMNNMAAVHLQQAKESMSKGETDKSLEFLVTAKSLIKEAFANAHGDPESLKISKNNLQTHKNYKRITEAIARLKKLKADAIKRLKSALKKQKGLAKKEDTSQYELLDKDLEVAQQKLKVFQEQTAPPKGQKAKPENKQAEAMQKMLTGALKDINQAKESSLAQQMPITNAVKKKQYQTTEKFITDALAKLEPPQKDQKNKDKKQDKKQDQKDQKKKDQKKNQKDQKKDQQDKKEKLDPSKAKKGEQKKEQGKKGKPRKIDQKQAEAILRQMQKEQKDFKKEMKRIRQEQHRMQQPDKNW